MRVEYDQKFGRTRLARTDPADDEGAAGRFTEDVRVIIFYQRKRGSQLLGQAGSDCAGSVTGINASQRNAGAFPHRAGHLCY